MMMMIIITIAVMMIVMIITMMMMMLVVMVVLIMMIIIIMTMIMMIIIMIKLYACVDCTVTVSTGTPSIHSSSRFHISFPNSYKHIYLSKGFLQYSYNSQSLLHWLHLHHHHHYYVKMIVSWSCSVWSTALVSPIFK